jgi:hypothetical protein
MPNAWAGPGECARVERAIAFSDFAELRRQEEKWGFDERALDAGQFFRRVEAGGWRDSLTPEQVGRIIEDHAAMMRRFGYIDTSDDPVECPL